MVFFDEEEGVALTGIPITTFSNVYRSNCACSSGEVDSLVVEYGDRNQLLQ
jgi:hypothetical protein